MYYPELVELIGRSAEQRELAAAWARVTAGRPELAVVWGRRRVGKTFLLTHFAADKRSVYFTATRQDTDERQLRRFAEALREQLGTEVADLAPETCRWQARPLTRRDLGDLQRRAAHLPPPGGTGLTYAFWSRGAGDELAGHPGVRTFTPADILAVIDS